MTVKLSGTLEAAIADTGSMPSTIIRTNKKATNLFFILSDLLLYIVCFVLWKRIYVENGCAIGFFRCCAPGGGSFVRRMAYMLSFLYHTTFTLRTQGVLHAEGGKIWGTPVLWLPLGARGAFGGIVSHCQLDLLCWLLQFAGGLPRGGRGSPGVLEGERIKTFPVP